MIQTKEGLMPVPNRSRQMHCDEEASLLVKRAPTANRADGTNESKGLAIRSSIRFDKWVEGTLWYVAAP